MRKVYYILFLLIFFSCSEVLMEDFDNSTLKYEDFESTWSTVNEVYPFLEFKNINWDSLYVVYNEKIEKARGDEYISVIFNLLCELKDGHVGLMLPGGKYLWEETPRQIKDKDSFDPNLTIEYLDNNYELTGKGHIGFATINDDIGYIHIGTLIDWESRWIYEIDNILNQFTQTKGLIIDVRHNGGGNDFNGDYITSHFLSNEIQTPGTYYKSEYRPGYIIKPKEPYYDKKVAVLTNGKSFSSTEDFVMIIQQINNVILIGDTTGGGSGAPAYYPLPSGLQIRISKVNILQFNHTPIEWNGIVPDILIPQSKTDIKNKRDKQLERAIEYLEK